jgi:hypothetical protein
MMNLAKKAIAKFGKKTIRESKVKILKPDQKEKVHHEEECCGCSINVQKNKEGKGKKP